MRTVLIMKKLLLPLVSLSILTPTVSACGSAPAADEIVATHSVLASIVQLMVGETAKVVTVVPDGKDPHEFEPSAGDVARITNARIVVSNGFGYEPTLQKAIAQARSAGSTVFDAEWEMPGLSDPHWFTDPLSAADVLARLLPVMEKATGLVLDNPLADAVEKLQETVAEGKKTLSTVPEGKCTYAVEHVLLAPFGDRFACPGSVVLNTGSRLPDAQPSGKDIENFVNSIREHGIRAIVEDSAEPSNVLAQVSAQTGAELVKISVHGTGGAVDYPGYVLAIARALADSLS